MPYAPYEFPERLDRAEVEDYGKFNMRKAHRHWHMSLAGRGFAGAAHLLSLSGKSLQINGSDAIAQYLMHLLLEEFIEHAAASRPGG